MTVNLMINFARSGGTLLNRCLVAVPNIVVLSEVNPLGGGWGATGANSPTTVQAQALAWYGIKIPKSDYAGEICALHQACKEQDKTLIVRDWSFVNFVPYRENKNHPPNRLLALEALQRVCDVQPFAFVRDVIDVWISRQLPPVDSFFEEYLRYVCCIKNSGMPVYKYEELCADPDLFMVKISKRLNIPFSEQYKEFGNVKSVHGDVQNGASSRGCKASSIRPISRRYLLPWQRNMLNACTTMKEANTLFGYPTLYDACLAENAGLYLRRSCKQLLPRIVQRIKRKMRSL